MANVGMLRAYSMISVSLAAGRRAGDYAAFIVIFALFALGISLP